MTLETGVKELAEAVGADVKALADGKVDGADPRLTDAREWSADTVTQAEAEAGTASTRRAWTAQRVRQAIAAWYLTVSTTFTRTLLGRSTAAQVRGDLGLGTAATRNVGESSGNVMQVGAFGLGRSGGVGISGGANLNDYVFNGFYTANSNDVANATLNCPVKQAFGLTVLPVGAYPQTSSFQILKPYASRSIFTRYAAGGNWSEWFEIHHTGNIQSTTGQSIQYPMTQKAVTDAINARGFADASGVLTVSSGALSNDMSSFLSSLTFAEMRSKLDVISKQSVQALDPDTATLPDLIRALQAP